MQFANLLLRRKPEDHNLKKKYKSPYEESEIRNLEGSLEEIEVCSWNPESADTG